VEELREVLMAATGRAIYCQQQDGRAPPGERALLEDESMEQVANVASTCRVIRSAEEYQGKQGPSYAGGISAESVGSQAIWLGMVTMPPGSRTKAHLHDGHETAIYVLSGECDLWYGEDLQEHDVARAGDYIYIPAGISHVAVNRSQTEPFVVVGGRTDPREQESVLLQPELDAKVPGACT
jgi:uncharacterized RmlC-like cupin family protein